jgi:predicted Zn-dependent protease
MNPLDDNRDEEQIEALLAAAARDVAPPDAAFLARLREQSTDVFQTASQPLPTRKLRGRLMTTRLLRALAACLALSLLGSGLYWWLVGRDTSPALADVLANVAHARSIHLQIERDGQTSEVWAEPDGRLRRDDPDGTYQIAAGGKLWRIDEKANRAASGKSPYHRVDRGELDLFALLGLPAGPDDRRLASSRPSGHAESDGVDCLVYHLEVPAEDGAVEIEALVERQTLLLHRLQARQRRAGVAQPVAALSVLAYNQAVAQEKFVVRDTLTEDGRVGKLTDVQGVVGIKPRMHQRWTPVGPHALVKPGDWLRTDLRGANAADLRLVKRTRVILGPGTLVEVNKPEQIRLIEGELEITVPADAKLELLGPDKKPVAIKGSKRYRIDKEQLVTVADEPRWLKAFKGKTSDESIGSLIAKVDGRNEPLTVGLHKVTVDIRDQIARTVIEESFVNHTNMLLEGVFHFPLPPSASISGFGMWVGDRLVEADIVEKQRAREIYETILQEKRDPGLLEWTGGNIFKARVYPIFAHSEKRIKITYTQVLPSRGGQYRYSYGLQSELLQLHPLRELAIDVKVHSATALKNVNCPTHPVRLDQTGHSAHVEFTAQEYTPTRDFEVVVETDGKQSDMVLIPHRRGDDGYFMLQVTPPASGDIDRDILPDGEPLDVLVIADTSASMDSRQRAVQANFVAALLSCLTPKDRVNLAACDVDCDWAFEKAVPAEPVNVVALRDFLARRISLGWTDLDRAFASALKQCRPNTHVVYVGDGIITTGDADAVAFTKRLRKLYEESGKVGTFHAVSPGSSYESGVLKAIASLGGGSVRHVGADQTPALLAQEMLAEIVESPLRDVKVEFRGLRTARVYPEELPNVPDGSQQIILGRYLPEGRDQVGEVIVTGTRNGKPVRFSTSVSLADAEEGNSFLPRLWARMHLDQLLEQGSSQSIHDEIVALSEEYQIITPYTSLLVLESDADRERFKVKRTFRMRDGEKFFAQGRDNADYELKQQQMKRAGAWRLGLHRLVLRQLATLGRDSRWLQSPAYPLYDSESEGRRAGIGGAGFYPSITAGDFGVPAEATYLGAVYERDVARLGDKMPAGEPAAAEAAAPLEATKQLVDAVRDQDEVGRDKDKDVREDLAGEEAYRDEADKKEVMDRIQGLYGYSGGERKSRSRNGVYGLDFFARTEGLTLASLRPAKQLLAGKAKAGLPPHGWYLQQSEWLASQFPALPSTGDASKRPSSWPAEARALARSLLRTDGLAKRPGGFEIVEQTEAFDVRWDELSSRSRTRTLLSAGAWLRRVEGDGQATLVQWCDGRDCGVLSRAFQLGRLRTAAPDEARTPPVGSSDYSLTPLDEAYVHYIATLQPQKDGRTLLILRHASSPEYEARVLIDTTRHVALHIEQRQAGKRTSITRYDDFVEVGGQWWATKEETADAEGRVTARSKREIKVLTGEAFAQQMKDELADRGAVLFLREPMKTVAEAKRAAAAGKATFDDAFTLLRYFAGRQQWTRALEQMAVCEKLAAGKPGVRWLRYAVLQVSRHHEELRKRLLDEAERLAKAQPVEPTRSDDLVVANKVASEALQVLEANEMLALLDQLRPIYARQPAHRQSLKHWLQQRLSALQRTGRWDEVLRLQKQLATDWPRDYGLQQQYAGALASGGDYPAAYAWLQRVLDDKARWLPYEEESLRGIYTQFLEAQGRYPELIDYLAAWMKRNPESLTAYAHYLSALIRNDQLDKATALMKRWLGEGQQAGERSPARQARLQAAINQALGQGHNLYTNRIEEDWLKPLADAALTLARQPDRFALANQILGHWQFQQSDEAPRVRKALLADLTADIGQMTPERIEQYIGWIARHDPAGCKPVIEGLRKRWAAEADEQKKHQLGQSLTQLLRTQGDSAALLAFLHKRRQGGSKAYRIGYTNELFTALLDQPWSAEYEDEAFSLLGQLSDAEDAGERLRAQVAALYQLTDRMIAARRDAKQKAIEHPDKLTRTELQKKQEECLRQARTGFADRLKKAAEKEQGPLAQWLKVERLYLLVRLEQELPQVATACWEILGAEPPPVREADEETTARQLDDMLRQRCLLTLMNLAARKGADAARTARLEKYIDRGITAEADGHYYKQLKYWLLIAGDRPKDLEQSLTGWLRADDPENQWRVSLAYVLAEQGRIPEAIKQLEAIGADDDLGPAAYRTLADWYLAANRREQHERALLSVYRTMDEWHIHQILSVRLRPWQQGNGQASPEVNADVLGMVAVLLEKSSSPQQHLGLLQQFYHATHDFRLVASLADAAIGHTAERAYPLLHGVQPLLADVDEAAVDELAAHLKKLRPRIRTTVDRRALDLLECLSERRAAELKNQPGPHAAASLAALHRAGKGDWSPGEPRLMADFLASLGAIPQEPLAKELLWQLEGLHSTEAKGSFDRLHVAHCFARALDAHRKSDPALTVLQAALDEYQEANHGVLPPAANDALGTFINYLESRRHYDRGEKVLLDQLRHPAHEQQRYWLTRRLYQLYHNALASDGEVSLGRGLALYQAVERKLRGELAVKDPEHQRQLIDQLCRIYGTAHEKKLAGAGEDLRNFAFKLLPELLPPQTSNYQSTINNVAYSIHNILGPRDGVAFVLDRIGHEPAWFRFNNQDGWSQFAYILGQWKQEARDIGDLEEPLLKLVLSELRRDLQSRQHRNRILYHQHYGYFWTAKEAEFAKVAEEVLAKHLQSGAAARYIADYFYDGLFHYPRGIEILVAAHKAGLLDDDGQSRLVDFLQQQKRYAESIALLEALMQRRPTLLHDRTRLMRAYFFTNRRKDLLTLLKETDAFFHKKDLWNEAMIAGLGASCLDNQLYAESKAYYNEVISLHQRTQPRRGVGNGVLSMYYAQLAHACAGLGLTAEAVDAASGAIVSWGPTHQNRAEALEALKRVLREAPNLDAYVAARENETNTSGLDSAVIRKSLGQIYLERGAPAKAIPQLQIAITLQPNDLESHRLLAECYDKQGDKPKAILALLQAAETSRRDIKLYQDIGRRLADRPREAERAYTSVVEVMPNESEGHALLAEIRQEQNRWSEAATQWQQVARIRALEPTGLVNLAAAQVHLHQWDQAQQTLSKVRSRPWPPRFNNVTQQVRDLEEKIKAGRKN